MQPKLPVLAYFPLILTGVLLNAGAQLFLKAGMRRIGHFAFSWANVAPIGFEVASNPFIWAGLTFYAISVVVWLLVLSRVPVGVAYPMLSIGYIVNAAAGAWFFGETLSGIRVLGIFIIIAGVYLVARN
ncbi:MAG TPA: transporter [Acidiferrobacteraceae bacterium]|nr:transporter [Acidiferrobacteraceae bacterium]